MPPPTLSSAPRTPCARCEALPPAVARDGTLYLWFPLGHSFGKVVEGLKGAAGAELRADARCVVLPAAAAQLGGTLDRVTALLSSEESRGTRAFFKEGGGEPTFNDFAHVTSLETLTASAHAGWLVTMVEERRLTSHFQPIVEAASLRPVAYEALLRGIAEDGALVPPGRIFAAAKDAELVFQVDLAARQTAIAEAARARLGVPVFVNFTPTAIYDPNYCLRTTVAAVEAAGLTPDDVVFEVIETERVHDPKHLLEIIRFYRARGFRVALDDLGSGYSSLNLLHQLRPDVLKIDMELVRGVDGDPYKAAVTRKLIDLAKDLGVRTIGEGVETEAELGWLRSAGVDWVQGYLIGRPAPVSPAEPPGWAVGT